MFYFNFKTKAFFYSKKLLSSQDYLKIFTKDNLFLKVSTVSQEKNVYYLNLYFEYQDKFYLLKRKKQKPFEIPVDVVKKYNEFSEELSIFKAKILDFLQNESKFKNDVNMQHICILNKTTEIYRQFIKIDKELEISAVDYVWDLINNDKFNEMQQLFTFKVIE